MTAIVGTALTVLGVAAAWIGVGVALMVLAYLFTAAVSLAYRVLARDPHPANDPAVALGIVFPLLIGGLTVAPFGVAWMALASLRGLNPLRRS